MSVTEETQSDPSTQKWICETCGLVYDPQEGDPDGDILVEARMVAERAQEQFQAL